MKILLQKELNLYVQLTVELVTNTAYIKLVQKKHIKNRPHLNEDVAASHSISDDSLHA